MLVPGSGRAYSDGDMIDHRAPLVFAIDDVFSVDECVETCGRIQALGPTAAPITTAAGFVMRPDIRNNTRVMFDDAALAARLFDRIAHALPAQLHGRRPVGVNERFRCYRYEQGQQFRAHYDGAFVRDDRERSELTLMVYLNSGFTGGETAFFESSVVVQPRTGMALLFQHRQLHEGAMVTSGVKYVLRSDVMFSD